MRTAYSRCNNLLLVVLLLTAVTLIACEKQQGELIGPDEASGPDGGFQVEKGPDPAGSEVEVDSLKYISDIISLDIDSDRVEATLVAEFWPEDETHLIYDKSSDKHEYRFVSTEIDFHGEANPTSGESSLTLNSSNVVIPPFDSLKQMNTNEINNIVDEYNDFNKEILNKILFLIHEIYFQSTYRSVGDPRVDTKFEIQNIDTLAPEDLELVEVEEGSDEGESPEWGWQYSPYACCVWLGHESFGSAFGWSPGVAYHHALSWVQAGCNCWYCLGCVGYIGPDVYEVIPWLLYFAEGCGRMCLPCAYC